ncbi:hypothetical protein [Sphingomonas aliaeris]|uniref:hypothetical protein n=1 Tax=Sphingomonas aliaeris TaxID=2759526 RepID=UPI001CECE5CF|nr:hypothetical protein [Sphingomonas aliaeris]
MDWPDPENVDVAAQPFEQRIIRAGPRIDVRRKAAERPIASGHGRTPGEGRPEPHHRQRDHGFATRLHDDRASATAIGRQRSGVPLIAEEAMGGRAALGDVIDQTRQPF